MSTTTWNAAPDSVEKPPEERHCPNPAHGNAQSKLGQHRPSPKIQSPWSRLDSGNPGRSSPDPEPHPPAHRFRSYVLEVLIYTGQLVSSSRPFSGVKRNQWALIRRQGSCYAGWWGLNGLSRRRSGNDHTADGVRRLREWSDRPRRRGARGPCERRGPPRDGRGPGPLGRGGDLRGGIGFGEAAVGPPDALYRGPLPPLPPFDLVAVLVAVAYSTSSNSSKLHHSRLTKEKPA